MSSLPGVMVSLACGIGRLLGIAVREDSKIEDRNRQISRHINLVHFIQGFDFPRGSRLLDVGCGSGMLAECFIKAGFPDIAGCDWHSKDTLLPGVGQKIVYSQIDLNKDGLSSYSDKSYDIIICSDVLEHLENPAYILRECERVLAPGGHLFLTIPNAFNLYERYCILRTGNSSRYRSERHSGPFGHISLLPSWVLESLLDRANLQVVAVHGGYCWWADHFWLPGRIRGPFFSYNIQYCIKHKPESAGIMARHDK